MADGTVVRGVKGRIEIDTSDLNRASASLSGFDQKVSGSLTSTGNAAVATEEKLKGYARTHRTVVVPAHEATTGSAKKLEEAMHHGSIALGEYGGEFDGLSKRLGGVQGLLAGGLGLGLAGIAGAAAAGGAIELAHSAIENAEASDVVYKSLHQAATVSKQDYGQLQTAVKSFIETNRGYISNEYDAVAAMASFTRSGLDQATSTKALGASLDLANLKHISLADAAHTVLLALNGNGRAVRELGIDLKSLTKEEDTSETSSANLTKAQEKAAGAADRLAAAQRALVEFEDGLHAKKTVTQLDLDHEADKKKVVADATQDLADAQTALAHAQDETTISSSKQAKVLDEIATKTEGGRESITKLQQQQNELGNTWRDLSADAGPQFLAILTSVGGATDAYLRGLSGKSAEGKKSWQDINDLLVDTAIKWRALYPPTPPSGPAPPLTPPGTPAPPAAPPKTPGPAGAAGDKTTLGDLGDTGRGVDLIQRPPDLKPWLELTRAYERALEMSDRFSGSLDNQRQANQRAGEIAEAAAGNLAKERDESDFLSEKNKIATQSAYDFGVAQNSLTTRTHEVLSKFRDEADTAEETDRRNRAAWGLTKAGADDLAAHINSEHIEAKVNIDYGEIIAAQFRWDNLIQSVAIHRGELTANFTPSGGGGPGTGYLAAGGSAIPGHMYTVGEDGPETLFMGQSGGYVVPHRGGVSQDSSTSGDSSPTVNVYAETNASPYDIANEVGWEILKHRRT